VGEVGGWMALVVDLPEEGKGFGVEDLMGLDMKGIRIFEKGRELEWYQGLRY